MEYRIGICDDEMSTCSWLEMAIHDYMTWHNYKCQIYVWDSSDTFIKELKNKVDIDILFLDIRMPGIDGIEAGVYIREHIKDKYMNIIYMSSAIDYAMQLFKIHPYEFLEKPFNKDRLYKILDDLMDMYMKNSDMFFFKKRGDQIGIRFNDICYFQSDRKHVQIIKSDGMDEYVGKLSDIINDLPAFFVPVGKSYIVKILISVRHTGRHSVGIWHSSEYMEESNGFNTGYINICCYGIGKGNVNNRVFSDFF